MKSPLTPIFAALAVLALSSPVAAQEIPDYIPDDAEESLADREQKRMTERYRHILSRFFSTGSVDMAPVTDHGFGYQASVGVGYRLPSDDAVFATLGARAFPSRDLLARGTVDAAQWHVRIGYQAAGTGWFGDSPWAHRLAVDLGAGVLVGRTARAMTVDVAPTYAVLQRDGWSVPVGVRLDLTALGVADAAVARAFLAVELGVRWQWLRRERLK